MIEVASICASPEYSPATVREGSASTVAWVSAFGTNVAPFGAGSVE